MYKIQNKWFVISNSNMIHFFVCKHKEPNYCCV